MRDNDSIRLHPKYGLNPTIPLCFYCGKEKNEIALLGIHYRDEAPMNLIVNIEPCDACKEAYKEYTLLVEVGESPRFGKPPEPTGRWVAVRREALNVPPTPIAYVDEATMNHIMSSVSEEVET